MHDGVYSFELGIVSFDIILERSGFARDLQVLSLRIRVDGSAGVVTLILPYWVTETRLLNGSRSRWSLILGCQVSQWWHSISRLPGSFHIYVL